MTNNNYQRFDSLPDGWTFARPDERGRCVNEHDPMKWSGLDAPPPVGTRVKVGMNGLGPGTVKGYFIEHSWLGVLVDLSKPPAWWKKQNADQPDRLAHIFGAELKGFRKRKQA